MFKNKGWGPRQGNEEKGGGGIKGFWARWGLKEGAGTANDIREEGLRGLKDGGQKFGWKDGGDVF